MSIKEQFAGFFEMPNYDGSYGTPGSHVARHDFSQLTNGAIMWSQVHGDFKDAAKRVLFTPYQHWPELYESCRAVLKAHRDLDTQHWGPATNAKLMGDVMTVLREKHKANVPRWWLPIMNGLRGNAAKRNSAVSR